MKIKFEVEERGKNKIIFKTDAEGNDIIRAPLLNKGTAFTKEERERLKINGLIPQRILTIDQQIEKVNRRYHRLGVILDLCKTCEKLDNRNLLTLKKEIDISRYNFLRDLQDRNELLFYSYCYRYLEEILPIVYTPTVGDAVIRYSRDSARFRGVFFSPGDIDNAEAVFDQFRFKKPTIAVVTDNQGILGLGDQGVGGMNIPIGKIALYVIGAGIRPWETIPICLDVGTDNVKDLEDPHYLGCKTGRLQGEEYSKFVDKFVNALQEKFPSILIQWEDFSRQNAFTILDKYRFRVPSFNDDIQGTGSVALAGILNAMRLTGEHLLDQKFVIYGAGAGGIGIARRIAVCLESKYKLTKKSAHERISIIDSKGLVTEEHPIQNYKKPFVFKKKSYSKWSIENLKHITLLEVIKNLQPSVLIGTSGRKGHFTQDVIVEMTKNSNNPIIFPLSNPTSNSESTPQEIYKYSKGKAIVATGSPFETFRYNGKSITIGQGNNFFIFPGVGLGTILSKGNFIDDSVFTEVAFTLSKFTPQELINKGTLYPSFKDIREISANIALTTIQQISKEQLTPEYDVDDIISKSWIPNYHPIEKIQ